MTHPPNDEEITFFFVTVSVFTDLALLVNRNAKRRNEKNRTISYYRSKASILMKVT